MSHIEGEAMKAEKMRTLKEWFTSSQVLCSMLLVQIFVSGMQLLSRVILVQGTFIGALIVYRHLVAAIFVAPFALYFERGRPKKFNCKVWFWLFINALMGMALAQGLFYYGLRDTSATYSINFLNLVPISTFITSIICRMENLKLQTWVGKAKSGGAILCLGGALVKLLKVFPLRYWGTMVSCILAAIQAAIVGSFLDASNAAWRIELNLQLIAVLYSGALATAATFCMLSWAITIKGPSYPPMFNPLSLIFVSFSEAILLGEPLGVGTLVGMVLIIMGLYLFLWGKKKDTQSLAQPNVADAEGSTMMGDGLSAAQSASTVVTSASPTDSVVLQVEKD
ncbi:unnamed protein product [Sphenostylis stenocarpa]|uniref:WAT1-related protein n=1 Tax=Sphenostylis stenocarpa TaxID=92480 RepID=A0AA86SQL5_9FABA|nr:unnamed protein product [Sphenostylis stenocarpa]